MNNFKLRAPYYILKRFILLTILPLTTTGVFGEEIQRFCELTGTPSSPAATWSKDHIQSQLQQLLSSPQVKGKVAAAYPISYLDATRSRDEERCREGGELQGSGLSELIGDHLADLMSRHFILAMSQCHQEKANHSQTRHGFCQAIKVVDQEDHNTMISAIKLTSVYLGSHMATSLLAVIWDDHFWNRALGYTPSLEERLKHMRAYKPLYDKNNLFLAKRLWQIPASLLKADYIRERGTITATRLVLHYPLWQETFRGIRNRTFRLALNLAAEYSPQRHPMLKGNEEGFQATFESYAPASFGGESFEGIERFAFHALNGHIAGPLFRALGAKTQKELDLSLVE